MEFKPLSEERKKELVTTLTERFTRDKEQQAACPMCGRNRFQIADAYVVNILQPDFKTLSLGGPSIPAVAIICTHCGFISQHALGMIGQLPSSEVPNGDK